MMDSWSIALGNNRGKKQKNDDASCIENASGTRHKELQLQYDVDGLPLGVQGLGVSTKFQGMYTPSRG